MPRHSPCALISLTYLVFANLEKSNNWFSSYKELCRLIKKLIFYCLAKIVIFLPIIKKSFPLLLPSHNCIHNNNVQFSRCIWASKKLNEVSFSRYFSQFLKKKWWAKMDSNHRPHDYQSCALASWAIGPYRLLHFLGTSLLYPLNWITHRQVTNPCTDLRTLLVDALLY